MAPLRFPPRLLASLLAALVACAGPGLGQEAGEAGDTPAQDPAIALESAEAAFLEADFESALELARVSARALEDEGEPAADPERALLARALDLIAQSLYNLGNEAGMKGVIDRLVSLEPGYAVDPETAGQRFVQRFDARRDAMTGVLQVVCTPLPCESVRIGGRALDLDAEGEARVLAGTLRVAFRRHGFREEVVEGLEIAPGEVKSLSVELVQVARDIVLSTRPPGVEVSLDGEPVATSEPAGREGGVSAPLTLLEVEPGVRSLVLSAPCLRRVERRIDVTLDRLDPGPIELGIIELEPVHAELEIAWSGPPATFVLDGSPVEPGVHRLCPGEHALSVSVGGRRVWFEKLELADDEVRRLRPEPRPTIALASSIAAGLASDALERWNGVELAEGASRALLDALGPSLDASPPDFPEVERGARPGIAASLRRFAPEADLVVLSLEGSDAIGRTRRLVLLAPEHGAFETTLVAREVLAERLGAALARRWEPFEPFVGLDLVALRDARVVVAGVAEGGPGAAAGLSPGETLLSLGGNEAPSLDEALALFASAPAGEELVVSLEGLDGGRRDAILKPARTLRAPLPQSLEGPFLLPFLARAGVWRAAGGPSQRMAGALLEGLSLSALGLDEGAARALDLASVDRGVDLAGDARGTITWLLEAALRRLGEPYADEVRTRLEGMDDARLGGRGGPSLRWRPR